MTDIVERLLMLQLFNPNCAVGAAMGEAADEIVCLRGLLKEWKEEPVGGITKFGVIYLSPERVAALVDPLREERNRLRDALHRISLGSQHSGATKEGLGREARAALGEGRA